MRFTRFSLLSIVAAALVVAVVLLHGPSATYAHRALQTGPTPPAPPFGTPAVTTPTPTKGNPTISKPLTKNQKTTLQTILKNDKTIKTLTKKRPYKIIAVAKWVTREGKLLGGDISLRFTKGYTIKGGWLAVQYDCTEKSSPPYQRITYKATYANVTAMSVFVDLKRKLVVGTNPLGFLVGRAIYPPSYKQGQTCES